MEEGSGLLRKGGMVKRVCCWWIGGAGGEEGRE
jgi:hypothetical protein